MLAQSQNAKKLHGTQLDTLTHNDTTLLVAAIVLAKFGRSTDRRFSLFCNNVISDIVDIDPSIFGSK